MTDTIVFETFRADLAPDEQLLAFLGAFAKAIQIDPPLLFDLNTEFLRQSQSLICVAMVDGKVVAGGRACFVGQEKVDVTSMFTLPAYRGQGLAKTIAARLRVFVAEEFGVTDAHLVVRMRDGQISEKAYRAYAAAGFTLGERQFVPVFADDPRSAHLLASANAKNEIEVRHMNATGDSIAQCRAILATRDAKEGG